MPRGAAEYADVALLTQLYPYDDNSSQLFHFPAQKKPLKGGLVAGECNIGL
jgi:hypothetical protein